MCPLNFTVVITIGWEETFCIGMFQRFIRSRYSDLVGKCRNGRDVCEDCQKAPISQIRSVHYTNCRKPWNCIGVKWMKGQDKKAQGIDERNTGFDKCMEASLIHGTSFGRKWKTR
jgi:hypothetical protein